MEEISVQLLSIMPMSIVCYYLWMLNYQASKEIAKKFCQYVLVVIWKSNASSYKCFIYFSKYYLLLHVNEVYFYRYIPVGTVTYSFALAVDK